MRRRTPDFNLVRELARDLGDVEESTTREDAFIKVRGKLLTWIPVNKSAEPGSLAVRIDLDHRSEPLEALFISAEPVDPPEQPEVASDSAPFRRA